MYNSWLFFDFKNTVKYFGRNLENVNIHRALNYIRDLLLNLFNEFVILQLCGNMCFLNLKAYYNIKVNSSRTLIYFKLVYPLLYIKMKQYQHVSHS